MRNIGEEMSEIITVGIVDNDVLVLEALSHLIRQYRSSIQVIWTATTTKQAIEFCVQPRSRPQVVLTDIQMPAISGIELAQQLARRFPQITVIGLTAFTIDPDIEQAAPMHILPKDIPIPVLLRYIGITTGKDAAIENSQSAPVTCLLSRTEIVILQQYAQGRTTSSIAHLLNNSETTIKTHMKRAFAKLKVHSRTEAVAVCKDQGWI